MLSSSSSIGARRGVAMRSILLAQALVILSSCATPPREYTDPRPVPTAQQRATFGTIAIAPAGLADPRRPSAPASKSNLEKAGTTAGLGALGAGTGAIVGLGCGPAAFVCVPVFAAAGGFVGLAGGVGGTFPYRTGEEVNSADLTLRNALLMADVESRLVEMVLAQASGDTQQNLKRVSYSIETNVWTTQDAEGGADTRLLIAASKVALEVVNHQQQANPDVRLEVVVEGRIFEGDRETPSFEREWIYDSESHSYFDWADEGGGLVTAEINRAVAVLGARIITDFLPGESVANSPRIAHAQGAEAVAALEVTPYREQQAAKQAAAAPPSETRRAGAEYPGSRALRVAILPFANASNAGYVAESEIETYIRRFVARHQDMELVYSAYDKDMEHPAVGAAHSYWSGNYVSRSPDEMTVHATAEALNADLVFMCFYQKRLAGQHSDDFYRFELYLLDVRQRRWYRQGGDEQTVGKALETIFWQLPRRGAAS